MTTTQTDLETTAAWFALDDETRGHALRLMTVKRPYEALRVLVRGTSSAPRARLLVAWLARMMVSGEVK